MRYKRLVPTSLPESGGLLERALAERADAEFRIAAIRSMDCSRRTSGATSAMGRGRVGNGIAETQCQQMFDVALDGIQMRFNLQDFLGKRVEAVSEGLPLGQWRKPDLLDSETGLP
jgi:hypothetical protein